MIRFSVRLAFWLAVLALAAPIPAFFLLRHYGAEKAREAGLSPAVIRTVVRSAHLRQVTFKGVTAQKCFAPIHVRADEISAAAKKIILLLEDRQFYRHGGSNPIRMAAAAFRSLTGRRQGGSTITQQLVKNTVFTAGDSAVWRKLLEPGYAYAFEQAASKDEILAAYLNQAPFLHGITGIEAFSRFHFGKPAARLTMFEAVQFARALNRPGVLDPTSHPEASRAEAEAVLKRLRASGLISEAEWRSALARRRSREAPEDLYEMSCGFFQQAAAHIDKEAQARIAAAGGERGHRVYVTINPRYQIEALAAADEFVPVLRKAGASQLAFVSLGRDGRLQAIVGSADIAASAWNRAIFAERQIGSVGKIPVLAAACEAGLGGSSRLLDAPQANGWPRNIDDKSHGWVTLAETIARSHNQAAVGLEKKVGVKAVSEMARRLGFTRAPARLGTSLGAFEATPLQVATALAIIANKGRRVTPWAVQVVIGPYGKVVYSHRAPRAEAVMSERCAAMVTSLLRRVVTEGTASHAGFDVPAWGKTGTTTDFVDAWFAGGVYATSAVAWVGNDSRAGMREVAGGGVPARMVASYFSNVVAVEEQRRKRRGPVEVAGGPSRGPRL